MSRGTAVESLDRRKQRLVRVPISRWTRRSYRFSALVMLLLLFFSFSTVVLLTASLAAKAQESGGGEEGVILPYYARVDGLALAMNPLVIVATREGSFYISASPLGPAECAMSLEGAVVLKSASWLDADAGLLLLLYGGIERSRVVVVDARECRIVSTIDSESLDLASSPPGYRGAVLFNETGVYRLSSTGSELEKIYSASMGGVEEAVVLWGTGQGDCVAVLDGDTWVSIGCNISNIAWASPGLVVTLDDTILVERFVGTSGISVGSIREASMNWYDRKICVTTWEDELVVVDSTTGSEVYRAELSPEAIRGKPIPLGPGLCYVGGAVIDYEKGVLVEKLRGGAVPCEGLGGVIIHNKTSYVVVIGSYRVKLSSELKPFLCYGLEDRAILYILPEIETLTGIMGVVENGSAYIPVTVGVAVGDRLYYVGFECTGSGCSEALLEVTGEGIEAYPLPGGGLVEPGARITLVLGKDRFYVLTARGVEAVLRHNVSKLFLAVPVAPLGAIVLGRDSVELVTPGYSSKLPPGNDYVGWDYGSAIIYWDWNLTIIDSVRPRGQLLDHNLTLILPSGEAVEGLVFRNDLKHRPNVPQAMLCSNETFVVWLPGNREYYLVSMDGAVSEREAGNPLYSFTPGECRASYASSGMLLDEKGRVIGKAYGRPFTMPSGAIIALKNTNGLFQVATGYVIYTRLLLGGHAPAPGTALVYTANGTISFGAIPDNRFLGVDVRVGENTIVGSAGRTWRVFSMGETRQIRLGSPATNRIVYVSGDKALVMDITKGRGELKPLEKLGFPVLPGDRVVTPTATPTSTTTTTSPTTTTPTPPATTTTEPQPATTSTSATSTEPGGAAGGEATTTTTPTPTRGQGFGVLLLVAGLLAVLALVAATLYYLLKRR